MKKRKLKPAPIGQKFGKLLVLQDGVLRQNGRRTVLCVCDCRVRKEINLNRLLCGSVKSCGCLARESRTGRHKTHGLTGTKIFRAWSNMIERCQNPKNRKYKIYGGRGIKICKRWLKLKSFVKDMGDPPTPKHSLDRINNDGDYKPSNCHWATYADQQKNRRITLWVELNGSRKTLKEWCVLYSLNYDTVWCRIYRWGKTPERALGFGGK